LTKFYVKISRLIATAILLFVFLSGPAAYAAAGEIDIFIHYKSRFVPPLNIPKFPEGLSAIKTDAYLLRLNRIERSWVVEIPSDNQYVSLTLFAGSYSLYNPIVMSRDNYIKYSAEKAVTDAWIKDMENFSGTKSKDKGNDGIEIPLNINIPKPVKSIIGEGGPRINVTGSRRISFSGKSQWDDLTTTGTFKQSKFPSLHMEQTSRFKIKGQIGSKISIEVDQDSNRDVDMANTLKLRYKGEEDEIIQSIEAGNTTLKLPNSQFIGFSQNIQGLFGIKATAKIGNINLTMITSQEKGSSEKSSFSAGTQASNETIWDYQYLHNVYFFLGDDDDFTANDSLTNIYLYREGAPRDLYGLACVDPHHGPEADDNGGVDTMFYYTEEDSIRGELERRNFTLIDETEYDLFLQQKYIILHQPIPENGVLAAYIEYKHTDSQGNVSDRQEGKVTGDTLVLKLLRDPDIDTSFATWDLEWRNVYDLRSRDLTREGFELQIYKGVGNLETDVLDQESTPFIQLFGFDEYENANPTNTTPDGLFDFNTNRYLDAARGHLIFQQPEPFANASILSEPNSTVYDYRYPNSTRAQSKKYYIYVKTAKRDNTFSLGKTNIIEGSEVVQMSDGRVLKRGTDYNIVYEIGQITFINDEALNAAADISVDFEYAPFFMPEKKSLFGLSAQYDINDKSFISFSGLYRKESSKEFRPRVGREPKRAMIWDSNIKLSFNPEFITSAVDALPLIETDAISKIEISGEVAQSFPNPNLRNRAYIDDFEGTREYTDLVTRRGVWTEASTPVGWELDDKRKLLWYNPYDISTIEDIWPEKDVQQHENRQDVLVLEWPDSSSGEVNFPGWVGIMRSMYSGLSDQSRTKFIEIWYKPDNFADEQPILYIDAGKLSEDLDGDGIKDTEDKNDDGVFQEDEDTGLDGLFNEDESGSGSDPEGDDWFYDDSPDSRYNYDYINGTENNREDPDRLNRFDTEDINNNGSLDLTNAYFQYEVDLNDNKYIQDSTSTGWRLLRIPFQDSSAFTTNGNPDFEVINFIRLWMTGINTPYKLSLATIQLVGNKWQELAPPEPVYMNGIPLVPDFEVTVKNTQEHSSYDSPPGIYGEFDQETGVQEKEQSLVLVYDDLFPGQSLGTYWPLLNYEDYTLYNKMKMFVHGDSNLAELDESVPLNFYFRVGADSISNYYEFRTKLYPGWDERNFVDIDFTELTALKSYLHANHPDSISLVDTTYGHYTVKGNPSLSQVKFFVLGVEYDSVYYDTVSSGDSTIVDTLAVPLIPVGGEVWCDELILTDVRRNSDFAGRMTASISLADLGDITFNFSRTGADFFRLNQTKPEGSLSTKQSVSSRISLDKFWPPSWGLNLPLTARWEKTLRLPRLKTGSDIILPDDLRQEEKTESKIWSVSASESFRKNTKNWLFNLTLNRITSSYTYAKKYSISPVTPVNNSTIYDVTGKYDLTPRIKPFFKPFSWTRKIFLPASIYDIKLFFLPTVLKFDAAVKSTRAYQLNNRGVVSSTYTRDFTGNQSYGMNLFTALKADFSTTTRRDISKPGSVIFSLNPSEIEIGRERDYSQSFSTSFTPKISRDLTPRIQFSSRYSDNSDLAGNPDSTRTTQLSANLRGDISLDVFKLTGIGKFLNSLKSENKEMSNKPKREEIPESKDGDPKMNGEEREPLSEDDPEKEMGENEVEEEMGEGEAEGEIIDDGETKDGGIKIPNPLTGLKKTLSVLNTVKPLKTTFSTDKKINRAGLYERPGWDYTLGFADQTSVRRNNQEGFNTRDQITHTLDYSFTSGISPLKNLDINSSYKNRVSITRGSNIPTKTKSVEFPRLDANLSGLDKLPLVNRLTTSVTLQTIYTRKIDESGNADSGELTSRGTNENYTPLLGLNFSFNKGVKATVRYDYNKRKSENLRTEGSNQRVDYSQDRTFGISVSYTLTAPQGLKIPIFGKFKFNSQLTMSLDYDKKYRKSWFVTDNVKSVDANSVETSVEPKVSYRFSAKVTGGFNAKWMDSNDKVQVRKRHIRELGIWTELRF